MPVRVWLPLSSLAGEGAGGWGKFAKRFTRLAFLLALLFTFLPLRSTAAQVRDSLLITPTTQGHFRLPDSGLTLEIAYATVNTPTHLTITRQDSANGARYTVAAIGADGAALKRFEMPLIAQPDDGAPWLIGWPQTFAPAAQDEPCPGWSFSTRTEFTRCPRPAPIPTRSFTWGRWNTSRQT